MRAPLVAPYLAVGMFLSGAAAAFHMEKCPKDNFTDAVGAPGDLLMTIVAYPVVLLPFR